MSQQAFDYFNVKIKVITLVARTHYGPLKVVLGWIHYKVVLNDGQDHMDTWRSLVNRS
jgi:CRISPR/Cas system endoribonuclease Cas6 (RAMP superfamily)